MNASGETTSTGRRPHRSWPSGSSKSPDSHRGLVDDPAKELRSDGIELSANTGIRVLHTYNFQMIFNLEFIYTMNDYNDRAVVFTIGIL